MKDFIYSQQESMISLLKTLVETESGSYDKKGVDQVASILIKLYEAMGFNTEVFENESFGNNYRLKHKDALEPTILIVAHLDTVFPKGTLEKWSFSIKDSYAFGPGVIDMKGSHVLTYFAIKSLFESQENVYKNIEILLTCDEELGSKHSRLLIEESAKGKSCALIMEPARSNGAIVSARRGVGTYTLSIEGRASHAGIAPEDGVSAIEELSYKIQALHALSKHKEGLSVNVGLISGGTSVNTVAPNAEAKIDVRITSESQGLEIDAKIKEICRQSHLPGIQLTLTGGINRPPMVKTEASEKLINIIKTEASLLGISLEDVSTGGGSDASFTAGVGVPTIDGLGPVGGMQHSDKEYLELSSLPERTLLFFNVLKKLY